MTWIDDNKRPLMAVGAILGVAWFGGRYFDKNQSFNALDMDLDRSDCCEVWVEKLYDDGKIGFGQAGNFLLGIEMGDLKCSSLGSPNCSKQDSSAEMFDAERIQYNYTVHREPKGSSKGGWFKSKKAETFEAEKEGMYFVFADGKTMMGLEDNYNAVYLEWKIPYSQIRDYVNEWTDNLKEDQEWRLNPYEVAYDFAHDKSAPDIFTEPFGEEYSSSTYTMEWAKEIEDAVKSRIWMLSDNYNDTVDLDEPMTKAEIRSFLTGIDSRNLTKRAETFEANDICHRSCYDGHEWRLSGTSHLGEYTTDGKPILNWRCDSCGQSKSSPTEPKSKADTHDWEMTKTKNWGDGVFTIYAECKRCGVKGYADGDVEESIDIQHPSLRAETFEAEQCKHQSYYRVSHNNDDWESDGERFCTTIIKCSDCGVEGSGRTNLSHEETPDRNYAQLWWEDIGFEAETFEAQGGYETPIDVSQAFIWETIPSNIELTEREKQGVEDAVIESISQVAKTVPSQGDMVLDEPEWMVNEKGEEYKVKVEWEFGFEHDLLPEEYRGETFEAKGDCAECYGTGGLYDSHMGINDECHSCGGTGFDY